MKPGEPTPKAARAQVCGLAALIPRPTNEVIKEQVKMRLGIELSLRTIGRICGEAGLPTSSRSNSGRSERLSSQMEQSGHWPNMRLTAKDLSGQLSLSLPQMLEFPWFSPRNEKLLVTRENGKVKVGHSIEEKSLFLGLRKHLPKDKAFDLFNVWKTSVGNIAIGLDSLCTRAKRGVRGHRWVAEEGLDSEEAGLTHFFVRSLVLEAAEEACGLPHDRYDWETLAPNNLRGSWLLRWVRGSSFVSVAAGPDGTHFDSVKELHQKLLVRLKSWKQIQTLGTEWLELEGITKALTKELDRVSNLALFPGKCNLCSVQ